MVVGTYVLLVTVRASSISRLGLRSGRDQLPAPRLLNLYLWISGTVWVGLSWSTSDCGAAGFTESITGVDGGTTSRFN